MADSVIPSCPEADETWRPVPGYEGYYSVSDQGRVRGERRTVRCGTPVGSRAIPQRILTPAPVHGGYLQVALSKGHLRTSLRVHLLVLEAFVGPRPFPEAHGCHGPGGLTDNRLVNLRWDTPSENQLDAVRAGTHGMTSRKACPREHLLVVPNLVACLMKKGYRDCLACNRARTKARNARVRRGVHLDWQPIADELYAELMLEAEEAS